MSNVRMEKPQAAAALDDMLSDYRKTLPFTTRMPIFGSDPLREAIDASPELRNRFIQSIQEGYVTGFNNKAVTPGAFASYSVTEHKVNVPESSLGDKNELIFVLGHENGHALSNKGVNFRDGIRQEIEGIAKGPQPHDYTASIKKIVDHTIRDEAQAHISGFNAVVSALNHDGKQPTPKNLYQFSPGRMRDFIEVQGAHPNCEYRMKAGLTVDNKGFLPQTPENIDAMKGYYPEKMPGTFGDNGLLNYRHEAVMDGLKMVDNTERVVLMEATATKVQEWQDAQDAKYSAAFAAASTAQPIGGGLGPGVDMSDFEIGDPNKIVKDANLETTQYKIDFRQLGVHPALLDVSKLGQDGNITVTNPITNEQALPDIVVNRQTGLAQLRQEADARAAGLLPPQPQLPQRPPPSGSPDELQNKLFFEAVGGVRGANLPEFKNNNTQMFNVAAALALEAHKEGLTSIDKVVSGEKGNLFAVQGDGPSPLRAHVNIAEAKQQPSEDTLVKLHASLTQQQQEFKSAAVEQQSPRIMQ